MNDVLTREKEKRTTTQKWRGEVGDDLNMKGIKNRLAMARDNQEWRKIVFEDKVHNRL